MISIWNLVCQIKNEQSTFQEGLNTKLGRVWKVKT